MLIQVSADGNCFFRAVADQILGDCSKHSEIRAKIVQHMRDNEELYAAFVEMDETFQTYSTRMAKARLFSTPANLTRR
jgi:OTU domain-containing protein 3